VEWFWYGRQYKSIFDDVNLYQQIVDAGGRLPNGWLSNHYRGVTVSFVAHLSIRNDREYCIKPAFPSVLSS
jgi:hypothetical protein